MDDFPEDSIKEDDSMMDGEEIDTTGEDYPDFRAQLSTPMSAADQCELSCSRKIKAFFAPLVQPPILGANDVTELRSNHILT